jgi:hypothetical protein
MGHRLARTTTGVIALAVLVSGCGSGSAAAPPVVPATPTPLAATSVATDTGMDMAPSTAKAKGPKGCLQARQEYATGSPGCLPKAQICANGALWWRADLDKLCGPPKLAHILIVSLPSAEWPGAEYCLVFSGVLSSPREAALVVDSPAANCAHDFVSARTGKSPGPDESPFYPAPQTCTTAFPGTRLTYPAALDYDAPGAKRPRQWACLNG